MHSSSDWLFGLWPVAGRLEPTTVKAERGLSPYQEVHADRWPWWGSDDLNIGKVGAGSLDVLVVAVSVAANFVW